MAYARHRIWHRVGPAAIATSALLIGLAAPGCDGNETTATGGAAGSAATAGTGGTGATGGTATGGTGGTSAVKDIVVSQCTVDGGDFNQPFDATPSPDGTTTYFTGNSVDLVNGTFDPAIFKLTCGAAPTVLASGDPLASPFGIATSTDGKTLYIADTASEDETGTMKGQLFKVSSDGGALTPISGTQGYQPRGLEVYNNSGEDLIYFSGIDPADGVPGLFSVNPGGGVSSVAKGAPFIDPSGVAVAEDGTIYVTDTAGSEGQTSSVIVFKGDTSVLVSGIRVGFPAGLALSMDNKQLFVSGLDPVTDGAVVLSIDLATKEVTSFNKGIENNTESAGLHRAKNADSFAWSDSTAGGTGRVYTVELK